MKRCKKPRKVQVKPQHKTIADQGMETYTKILFYI